MFPTKGKPPDMETASGMPNSPNGLQQGGVEDHHLVASQDPTRKGDPWPGTRLAEPWQRTTPCWWDSVGWTVQSFLNGATAISTGGSSKSPMYHRKWSETWQLNNIKYNCMIHPLNVCFGLCDLHGRLTSWERLLATGRASWNGHECYTSKHVKLAANAQTVNCWLIQ